MLRAARAPSLARRSRLARATRRTEFSRQQVALAAALARTLGLHGLGRRKEAAHAALKILGFGAFEKLDQKVTFFVRSLARGKHSLSYRMRAETPGKFSALPTRGEAMYAPELKANSDEIKISITD